MRYSGGNYLVTCAIVEGIVNNWLRARDVATKRKHKQEHRAPVPTARRWRPASP